MLINVSLVSNEIMNVIGKNASGKKYISMSIAVFTRKVLVVAYFASKNSS